MVNVAVVPVLPPVAPVTVCAVPDVVAVVKLTVAMPLALVVDVAALKLPPPVLDHVTTCPLVATALSFASASWAVMVTVLPATGLALDDVTKYFAAAPAIVVNTAVVPVTPPVAPVTVCAVPDAVFVVKVTVATPLAFVVVVGAEKLPPPVLDHVTTFPAVVTALLFASASCAVIVTVPPATGDALLDVTRYFVAAPAVPVAVKVIGLPVRPVDVAVSVFAPAVAPRVQLPTVATPLAFVVCVPPVTLPPPVAAANVTLTPATALLFTSLTITDGAVATAVPAVAV